MLTPKKPTLIDKTINNAGIKYTDQGKIESVSIQGTQIFVVVRLVGKNLPDMMGNTVSCGRHLVGLPTHAPEHTATMAEVLIPLNMNSSTQVVDPKTLIGSRVQVFFKSSGFPEGCTLLSNPDARSVSREELFNLRFESKDGIIDQFTEKKIQLTDSQKAELISILKKEKYDQTFHKGAVGVYGNSQNMFVSNPMHQSTFVDFQQKADEKTVINDVKKEVRKKDCYMPATVFTGKS